MIASGSKDQTVRIWYLTTNGMATTTPSMESKQVAVFDDHNSSV
jgi:hypothetical protein